MPSLEQIVVNYLYFNVDDHNVEKHTHHCSCTDVQGFFFHRKVNPFVCAQTQKEHVRVRFVVDEDDEDDANRPLEA